MANVLVVYWSGTGNTEIMAEKIKEGLESAGASVDFKTVDQVEPSDVANYDKIAFGCPSMGVETLEEDEFEPFFEAVEGSLSGKKIALFGSYGWGEGEWMDAWVERAEATGANLYDNGLRINSTPSSEEEDKCVEFGAGFASF
ncbi:MAG: flavodoxin [Tenericutes bacterium GWC2_34_14]|nr:MAG: flavodoxin [Tenericutes bacterium GWA2_35_7]OHE28353.1 MAG: flavodoxin [Tenericutes bacterium GWC2_34_14]OHE33739.1 MAG: flavodoxin [Tenericutes bacterium GWE2_34_108]OHE37024.1 MAG: flavodoxin [Tenericutes bacterium GWF1_35_14]OHE37896.1 MAG: flavodoxin [Tenericutes bacterium GWF2_35_184]OHE41073.1 MAG: flavodoxin [Tenericutes bacterium RIFOXYA12_FULL_35_10]OHE43588.1 MAG: flavodoxin [Tenericutes bacterium RIFOXYA2_FULL_36_32]OHE46495.1 MAG: flavodoxin [Tenericutes bacterium RIFOXYB